MSSKPGRSARLPILTPAAKNAASRVVDLSAGLPPPSEATPFSDPSDQITQLLYARATQSLPFTNIGRRALITVAVPKEPVAQSATSKSAKKRSTITSTPTMPSGSFGNGPSSAYSEERSKECADLFNIQATDYGKHDEDADLFHTVDAAYNHMLRDQKDQSIVLIGDSNSGKSENFKWILRHLCDLTRNGSKKTKLQSLILKARVVLNAFGNASTLQGANSTGHAMYQELQFSEAGKMVGLKLVYTLLDEGRVSNTGVKGNNFHIFYHMQGLSSDEKEELHLNPHHASSFKCLPQTGVAYPGDHVYELEELIENMKSLGLGRRNIAQIWRVLAAIMHLSNVEFDDIHGKSGTDSCRIQNHQSVEVAATLLGMEYEDLLSTLTVKTIISRQERISILMTSFQARDHRDTFMESLYASVFHWVVEQINEKLCQPEGSQDWLNYISIFELPGTAGVGESNPSNYYTFLVNCANEKLLDFRNQTVLEQAAFMNDDNPKKSLDARKSLVETLLAPNGILAQLNYGSSSRQGEEGVMTNIFFSHGKSAGFIQSEKQSIRSRKFGIAHSFGTVQYDMAGYSRLDERSVQLELYSLIKGSEGKAGSCNVFLQNMVSAKMVHVDNGGTASTPVTLAANLIMRAPTIKSILSVRSATSSTKSSKAPTSDSTGQRAFEMLDLILQSIKETELWFVYTIKTCKEASGEGVINLDLVKSQIQGLDLETCINAASSKYVQFLPFALFRERYEMVLTVKKPITESKAWCESIYKSNKWTTKDVVLTGTGLAISEAVWSFLCLKIAHTPNGNMSVGEKDMYFDDDGTSSHYDSEVGLNDLGGNKVLPLVISDMKSPINKYTFGFPVIDAKKPATKMSRMRKCWLTMTWATTFCIPSPLLYLCGMKDEPRRIAWREKVCICFLILLVNGFVMFLIVGVGQLICPLKAELSPGQISSYNKANNPMVYMYGNYYKLDKSWVNQHSQLVTFGLSVWESVILGQDISQMFDKSRFASSYCPRWTNLPTLFQESSPFFNNNQWYSHVMKDGLPILQPYIKGTVVWTSDYMKTMQSKNSQIKYVTINDKVYDIGSIYYMQNGVSGSTVTSFWGSLLDAVFMAANATAPGADVTAAFNAIYSKNQQLWRDAKSCLDGMYYQGRIDHRNDLKCQITGYILLAVSCILLLVIVMKFFAALDFTSRAEPALVEKFVILQIPCYTENEASIRRTVDTLTATEYRDKFKLLFIICDGMVTGAGNEKPTPFIVLDILGADPEENPPSLAFESVGEGNKRLNYGKVYTGLYEHEGHTVPYIVLVKIGSPTETTKPGNRGKRDSQLLLMKFLSNVTLNQPMSPLELEVFYKMKYVIGVNPALYEFVLMVDADTSIEPHSMNILVSAMTQDGRISGICGETKVFNERKTFCTMIQVYEYYISHNLAKAFESFFGSVTCLPGCFSLYRIRNSRGDPIITDPKLIKEYSECIVNTLHLKNLLHLGEDRFLTTLMIKHFPRMRTMFRKSAIAHTVVPDTFSVLFSQRRRWINSTVHNLMELLMLKDLCGFCLFNMRFVVFIELFATITGISSFAYIVYLVYCIITVPEYEFPVISLVIIAAAYGLQLLILIFNLQWQYLGWFFFYLLATPVFGVILPLYSFWNMDDFSWGNTRKIEGEQRAKAKENAEEVFNPDSIPLKSFEDYEREAPMDRQDLMSTYSGSQLENAGGGFHFGMPQMGPPPMYDASLNVMSDGRSVVGVESSGDPGAEPSNDQLIAEIRRILMTCDLMKMTKKSVRLQLAEIFGQDLTSKRTFINSTIDRILKEGAN